MTFCLGLTVRVHNLGDNLTIYYPGDQGRQDRGDHWDPGDQGRQDQGDKWGKYI